MTEKAIDYSKIVCFKNVEIHYMLGPEYLKKENKIIIVFKTGSEHQDLVLRNHVTLSNQRQPSRRGYVPYPAYPVWIGYRYMWDMRWICIRPHY
jgi:hypothetical protein